MTNKRFIFLVVLAATLALLSGCGDKNDPTATTKPELESPLTPGTMGYPFDSPISPEAVVSWEEAEALILSGQVEQVAQAHSLEVTLYLRDGRQLSTTEPKIDEVFDVIGRCGEPCADMILATE